MMTGSKHGGYVKDKNTRVPFGQNDAGVAPIRPDDLVSIEFSADEVARKVKSLSNLAESFGFENVVLNVADELIHLRANIETSGLEIPGDVDAQICNLEEKVRAYNRKKQEPASR